MTKVLLADNLNELTGIRHGFFTRAWGDCGLSSSQDIDTAIANRARVAVSLGVAPENFLSCYQIHSPDVVMVTKPWDVRAVAVATAHAGAEQSRINGRPKADAMVTNQRGIALGIITADCGPLLFADEKAGVIGAAHAGWRGAIGGVIENTLDAMEKLGARKQSIVAAIGPCIAQKSYEVGPEFPAPFLAENPANDKFFRPAFRSGHYMFDLPGYIVAKLRNLGVASVEPPPADTCADPEQFFSHRFSTLEGKDRAGSLVSVIVLAG